MTTVTLSLKTEDGALVDSISATFKQDDLALLRSYVQLLARVRTCTLLTRGMPAITNFKWESGTSMSFECAPYSDAELHELLHVLRPVILQKEATSFNNVAALLGRRFASRAFADHMKVIRRVFEHGELNLYMQVSVGGQPLFHESLLDTWLNGAQYHTDAEKAEAWRALEKSLSTPNARAVVMSQLQGKVKALFNLEYIVTLVLGKSDDS